MSHHHQQQQHQPSPGKKKVEWSTNLNSSESQQHTENTSPEWDSESDHNMLSYFLEGNGLATPPRPSARFPVPSVANAGARMSSRGNPSVLSDRILQHPFRTNNFQGGSQHARSMAMRQDQLLGVNHEDNDLRQPPPTPVIQHYYHSSSPSSSYQNASTASSGTATIPSGTPMPRQPTHQFPFTQQQQQQQQLDPIQAMKQNFMGAYEREFTPSGAGSNTTSNNQYAFQGYNATMEEAVESISPALEFAGDHEPLLLPGRGAVDPQPHKQHATSDPQFSSNAHALAGNLHGSTYGIPSGNPTAAVSNNTVMQPTIANSQAPVLSSQAAAAVAQLPLHFSQAVAASQKNIATSIPSSDTVAVNPNQVVPSLGGFPQPVIGPPTLVAGIGGNHPFFFSHHLKTAYLMQKAESAEETEEKRAKRLERNRESARKSRRRKKERLTNLEGKVNKLYGKIEKERRLQINSMDTACWKAFESEELLELKRIEEASLDHSLDQEGEKKLQNGLLRLLMSDIEQSTRKEIVEFQYNTLIQHLLPRYQKVFLWTILQSGSYFLSGKEEHSKREFSKKITTGKISSKQLGEEISNGRKQPRRKKGDTKSSNQEQSGSNQTACVSESEKFWPLVCFELSISVEQEERFLEAQGRSRQRQSLHRDISQIVAATRLASSAKECILYQIYLTAFRKRKAYNDVLTPRQAILYQEWLLSNRDRVGKLASDRRKRALPIRRGGLVSQDFHGERDDDRTLEELRRHLEETLKISKTLPG